MFNGSKTIQKTIASCLNQTFANFEILIIDDCSSDNSCELVEEIINNNLQFNIQLYSMGQNSGPSKCRNKGWNNACGEYIAFLDSDDIWNKNKLAIIFYYLEILDSPAILAHEYTNKQEFIKKDLDKYNYIIKKYNFYNILLKNISQTSAVVISGNVLERFDTSMRYTEDHDLWLRVSFKNDVFLLQGDAMTILGRPQLSKGGLSGNKIRMRLGEMKMYLKSTKYSRTSFILAPLLIMYSFLKYLRILFIEGKKNV
jgi:teichuronic acid biosynthesis glycosyltransferase TuaG